MKEIKAVIRPFKVHEVIAKLHEIENLPGLTVSEVKGFAKTSKDHSEIKPIIKSKLEIVVQDELVDTVVRVIQRSAFTGNFGDGKIFIHDVTGIVKIRTDDHGEAAI